MKNATKTMCAAKSYRADCMKPVNTEMRPKVSENAKRGEISLKEATKSEFARELKKAVDCEMGEMDKKEFRKMPRTN